jgi:hypothetical protein
MMHSHKLFGFCKFRDLSDWNNQRNIRLNKKKENNRTSQAVVIETLASEQSDKAAWARVLKMININDSPAAGKADVSRMSKIFIQLKSA